MRKTNILSTVIVLSTFGLSLFSCSSNKNEKIVNKALESIEERVYTKIRNSVSFPKYVVVVDEEKPINVDLTWEINPNECFTIVDENDDFFSAKPMSSSIEIEVTFIATAIYKGSKANKIINGVIMSSN